MSRTTNARAVRPVNQDAEDDQARILYLLGNVFHSLRAKRLEPALKELEVTPLQYTVLATVGRHAGLSSAELSRRFHVTQQTMGQLLNSLESRGWLLRTENPQNRRLLRHDLTPSGTSLVKQCDLTVKRIETEVLGVLSDAQRACLRDSLLALSERLRDEPMPSS